MYEAPESEVSEEEAMLSNNSGDEEMAEALSHFNKKKNKKKEADEAAKAEAEAKAEDERLDASFDAIFDKVNAMEVEPIPETEIQAENRRITE